jgi:hypothetical protein
LFCSEAEEERALAQSLSQIAQAEVQLAVPSLSKLPAKGDLRAWIAESTSPVLAPLRAFLVANPGVSNLWDYLQGQLFGFDKIFGVSKFSLDAQLLSDTVANAVSEGRLQVVVPLPHPVVAPFGTCVCEGVGLLFSLLLLLLLGAQGGSLAYGLIVQKVMASSARPALVQLVDNTGAPMLPRMLWKKGDDLRSDMIAMVFFEVYNMIWAHTLDPSAYEPVHTYQILPLKGRVGFLEWVSVLCVLRNV